MVQGRKEVGWRPGQEASLAPRCSNLSSVGSKFSVLKKVLVTLLGLFGALIVIRRPRNCEPLRWCIERAGRGLPGTAHKNDHFVRFVTDGIFVTLAKRKRRCSTQEVIKSLNTRLVTQT